MKRKYAPPIQHTIYKDGWKDALHAVGKAVDELPITEDNETSRTYLYLDDLEAALGKLVPER